MLIGNVVKYLVVQEGAEITGHRHLDTVQDHPLIIVCRLIQSQSQTGTASAEPLKDNAQNLSGVLPHNRRENRFCRISDRHVMLSFHR